MKLIRVRKADESPKLAKIMKGIGEGLYAVEGIASGAWNLNAIIPTELPTILQALDRMKSGVEMAIKHVKAEQKAAKNK